MIKEYVYDFEVFPNEYFAVFKSLDKTEKFLLYNNATGNNVKEFVEFYDSVNALIGWNNSGYDDHLLNSILNGKSTIADITKINDSIFVLKENLFFKRDHILFDPKVKFIDCMLLPEDVTGLKAASGWRLNADMVECSVAFDNPALTDLERQDAITYCEHDVDVTIDIFLTDEVQTNLAIRQNIVNDHSNLARIAFWTNSASLSDWIIADSLEACVSWEDLDQARRSVSYSKHKNTYLFSANDVVPFCIKFINPKNQLALLELMKIKDQDALTFKPTYEFEINGKPYKFGQGGMHFCDASGVYKDVSEIDVESFYPSLIRNLKIIPFGLDKAFIDYYANAIVDRLKYKNLALSTKDKIQSAKYKVLSDSLKLMLNTIYGQLKTKGKYVYSPVDSLRITIGGQLMMIMLCEQLNNIGIKVLLGNTDGLFVDKEVPLELVAAWETGLNLTFSKEQYKSFIIRDVNAIYGIKTNDKVKMNGCFEARKMSLPKIIYAGVVENLLNNTDISNYVRGINDLQQFQEIKKLNKNEKPLGLINKVNRYYRSANGIKIPSGADKIILTNTLPATFPTDINYDWYVSEIRSAIDKIMSIPKPKRTRIVLSEFDKHKKILSAAGVPFLVPISRYYGTTLKKVPILGWNDVDVLQKYKDNFTPDMMQGCSGLGFSTGSFTGIITIDIDDYDEAKAAGLFNLLNKGLITHHSKYSAKELKSGVSNCSFSFTYNSNKLASHSEIKGYELFYNDKEGKPKHIIQATGPHQNKNTGAITQYGYCGKLVPLPAKLEKFLFRNQPLGDGLFVYNNTDIAINREDIVYPTIPESTLSETLDLLSKLEPDLKWEVWRNISWATAHASNVDDAITYMKHYWPWKGVSHLEGDYNDIFDGWNYNQSFTFAYLKNRLDLHYQTKLVIEKISSVKDKPLDLMFNLNEYYPPNEVESEGGKARLAITYCKIKELVGYAERLCHRGDWGAYDVHLLRDQALDLKTVFEAEYGSKLTEYIPIKKNYSVPSQSIKQRRNKINE